MADIRIRITGNTIKAIKNIQMKAEKTNNLQIVRRCMAIIALSKGICKDKIASILQVHVESIRLWIKKLMQKGPKGLLSEKKPGRPSRLTKKQKKELSRLIENGPEKAGFPGACWRSPMVQELILQRFGILYSVHYISQLLKNLGFSYQKAKFDSAHIDPEAQKTWIEKTWPEIIQVATKKNAHIMFGDEASFPQWGSLTYTWARKGKQPVVKTSGKRKCCKAFGLIEYHSGKLFYKRYEGRLNSESYTEFLKEVLAKTRKHIVLIHDGAPYHKSKAMRAFYKEKSTRLTTYLLPPYSPKYNPIEMLWKKIKEKEIHLHYFPTFESLTNKVEEAMLRFTNMKDEILSLFGFYKKLSDSFLVS